jgi:uncharacterized protein (DUF1501 family)
MFSRREMLQRCSMGFGGVALARLMHEQAWAGDLPTGAELTVTHHTPRAKRVILCYMSGGVSHLDSFDPKPELKKWHGQPMPMSIQRTQFNNNGNVMASPFPFAPAGQCQMPVSSLFPNIAGVADELAVVRSMTTPFNEHAQGNLFTHTGFPVMGHPSAGAWCAYGLGSINRELPAYVVLQSGGAVPPHGGVTLYTNGFLPGNTQGSILQADRDQALHNLTAARDPFVQQRQIELARSFDSRLSQSLGTNIHIDAAIANMETAFRMQTAIPELCDISRESQATCTLYGIDHQNPTLAAYARQCLLARRLVEKGVRFIELSCLSVGIGAGNAPNPWDQHGELERGHRAMAEQVDQPIAALIVDLKQRGLLDDTLIIWTGEFGRTPFSQGSDGRDHNPFGFSLWLAGGGVRGGTIYGATDDFGYHAVDGVSTIYDLWATVLHLLGIDHERLTFRYSGRDVRLTDVHGRVLSEIL